MTGFFYAGPHCWVNGPERACDLGTMENAVDIGRAEDFGAMEIVVDFGDPICQWVVPFERRATNGDKTTAPQLLAA